MSHRPTDRPLKSFSDLAQNWLKWGSRWINVWNFRVFCRFFGKLEKIQTGSLKIGNFCSNSHYSRGHFFENFFFPETSHTWISGQINLQNFGTLEIFFAKSEKNPISSLKFCKISNLKSHYFQLFQKKSQIFQN